MKLTSILFVLLTFFVISSKGQILHGKALHRMDAQGNHWAEVNGHYSGYGSQEYDYQYHHAFEYFTRGIQR